MTQNRQRRVRDWLIGAASLGVLLLALTVIDERIRGEVVAGLSGRPAPQLNESGQQVRSIAGTVRAVVTDYSAAHRPLVVFGVVGVGLLVFMLRT